MGKLKTTSIKVDENTWKSFKKKAIDLEMDLYKLLDVALKTQLKTT